MMGKQRQEWKSREELYDTPANTRLKHIAFGIIAVPIAIIIVQIIWCDAISPKVYLFMRGCAGLFAIAFAVIVGILVYRVEREFINQK